MSLQSEAAAENAKHSSLIPALELIRGLASIEVFFSHLFLVFSFNNLPPWGRPFWMEAFLTFGSLAVVIFFVLSGLVIALSQRQNHRDAGHFMRARLRRLGPLYLVAMVLAFAVDRLVTHHFVLKPVWAHLLFLQSFQTPAAPLFRSNLPLWSLSYEFYFYLFFALTLVAALRGLRPALWLAGFAAMVPFALGWQPASIGGHLVTVLACMPVWLLGNLLVGKPVYFRPAFGQNLVLFSLTFLVARSFRLGPSFYPPASCMALALLIAPLLYCLANPRREDRPRPAVGSWAIVAVLYGIAASRLILSTPASYPYAAVDRFWLAVPPVVAMLVLWVPKGAATAFFARLRWQPLGLLLGRLSYAIYVVHMPVCALVHYKTGNPWLRILLDLILVALLSWLCEYKLHPWLCTYFDKLWPAGPRPRAAAFRPAQTVSSG